VGKIKERDGKESEFKKNQHPCDTLFQMFLLKLFFSPGGVQVQPKFNSKIRE
jgi:hypothetical protein